MQDALPPFGALNQLTRSEFSVSRSGMTIHSAIKDKGCVGTVGSLSAGLIFSLNTRDENAQSDLAAFEASRMLKNLFFSILRCGTGMCRHFSNTQVFEK
jgi:hypothetical protein